LPGIQSHSFQNRGVIMNKFASMQAMLVMWMSGVAFSLIFFYIVFFI
jgi:hypothetical protein